MVNWALRVIALWLTILFCLAWWPAVFVVAAFGCLWLADTRERNQRAEAVNAAAALPAAEAQTRRPQPRLPDPGRAPERIA